MSSAAKIHWGSKQVQVLIGSLAVLLAQRTCRISFQQCQPLNCGGCEGVRVENVSLLNAILLRVGVTPGAQTSIVLLVSPTSVARMAALPH